MKTLREAGMPILLIAVGAALGAALVWAIWYVPPREAPHAPPIPAAVPKVLKEAQINVITLTPEAIERLALRTAVVERKPMPVTRVYGGEVVVPNGHAIVLSAPLAGTLRAATRDLPRPGQPVKKGEAILQLLPLLAPEARVNLTAAKIEADGQVESGQTQVAAAKIVLDRAKRLLESEAGSKKAVDDAQAQLDLAQKNLDAVLNRQALLERVVGELDKGTAGPLAIEAPKDGILRSIAALPGQTVPSGAALFEVVDLDRVWVRVPVYAGDLKDVDRAQPASVIPLSASAGEQGVSAKPIDAPPSADAAAGTVDLFFELDNRKTRYSPGHRVSVGLKQAAERDSLTVPWAAVIYDIHGGAWVYEQLEGRQFVRRRVAVRFVTQGTAVLAAGPAVGAQVVVAGTAELFGAETGFSK